MFNMTTADALFVIVMATIVLGIIADIIYQHIPVDEDEEEDIQPKEETQNLELTKEVETQELEPIQEIANSVAKIENTSASECKTALITLDPKDQLVTTFFRKYLYKAFIKNYIVHAEDEDFISIEELYHEYHKYTIAVAPIYRYSLSNFRKNIVFDLICSTSSRDTKYIEGFKYVKTK